MVEVLIIDNDQLMFGCLHSVDCVGILKLRNADVEARIGVAGSKKKSTRARLVFRVNIPRSDGSVLTLQTSSSPILCSEWLWVIHSISLLASPAGALIT